MPRGTQLSDIEKGKIEAFRSNGLSFRAIAKKISRSDRIVRNFWQNQRTYGTKLRSGRPQMLTRRDKRRLINAASNSVHSLKEMRDELGLGASVSTLSRALKKSGSIVRAKMVPAPNLTTIHKQKRLEFARQNMNRNWKTVIFSDEKKFNLDGPDGFNGYWHDLRKEKKFFSKRNFGGGGCMVWGAFCDRGKVALAFTTTKMKSCDYTQLLQENLVPYLRRYRRIRHVFQQDNAPIHVSRQSLEWFEANHIDLMDWPARSPDCNPIENLWGILTRKVYAHNRQFVHVEELKEAIMEEWSSLDDLILKNLVSSMPKRIFSVIEKRGNKIPY